MQCDSAPSGFQLTFAVDPGSRGVGALVDEILFTTFNRVAIVVATGGIPTTLIDGFITHFQRGAGSAPGTSTIVVTGEDLSVAMDRVERSFEFPLANDMAIVLEIMLEYVWLGLAPLPSPGLDPIVPFDHVPQQAATDRALIQQLATRNGFVFCVRPGPVPFANVAYWGPPPRAQLPQVVLDAIGPTRNVESLQFEYDPRAATGYAGLAMETSVVPNFPVPVVTMVGLRLPPFASMPALNPLSLAAGAAKTKLWQDQELDPVQAWATAQAASNISTDRIVTGTCEVSPERIGRIVTAPAVVGVRNASFDYDGLYYVPQAAHRISLGQGGEWDYRETLTLTREGTGSTTPVLAAF